MVSQGPVDAERQDKAAGPEHDPAEFEDVFRAWGVSAVVCLAQKRSVLTGPAREVGVGSESGKEQESDGATELGARREREGGERKERADGRNPSSFSCSLLSRFNSYPFLPLSLAFSRSLAHPSIYLLLSLSLSLLITPPVAVPLVILSLSLVISLSSERQIGDGPGG